MFEFSVVKGALESGYGVLVLITTVALTIFVKFFDVILAALTKYFSKREKLKGVLKREQADLTIQELLNTALYSLGGERIQVIEFSNTVRNIALVPFMYMTCTYESYVPGKQAAANTVKNELTSLYAQFLSRLRSNSFVAVNAESPDDSLSRSIYSLQGSRFASKSLYVPIIDDRSKKMIGYVSYDVSSIGGFSEKELVAIRGLASQLSILLTLGSW